MSGRLKLTLIWVARVFFFAGMMETFFLWAPWIACKPLSNVVNERIAVPAVPAWSKCYVVEHGKIVFRDHGTVAESPIAFAATTALLLVLWALVVWSFFWNRPGGARQALRQFLAGKFSRGHLD